MDIKHICYTGVGARKKPKHSVKQFLKAMKQKKTKKQLYDNNSSCKMWIKRRNCKSCKRSTRMTRYITRQIKKNPNYKMSKRLSKKWDRLLDQCLSCSEKIHKKKPCDLNQYLEWSGADANGNC